MAGTGTCICGICNNNIVRKSVICSICLKSFHSYCVDLPINKSDFRCSECMHCDSDIPANTPKPNMDTDVQDSIKKMLVDIAQLKIKQNEFADSFKALKKLEDNSTETFRILDSMQSSLENVAKLEVKVAVVENKLTDLISENDQMKNGTKLNADKLLTLQKRCDVLEHYAFQTNCEIRGIPVTRNEDLFDIVGVISSKIGFNFDKSLVKYIHRTFSARPPKPIVIEFISKFTRNNFLECVKLYLRRCKLNANDLGLAATDSPIFIVEHISSWKKKLLMECKKLKTDNNFKHVWVKFGKIYCKMNDDSSPVKIDSFDELTSFRDSLKSLPEMNEYEHNLVEPDNNS